jgi:DMSO/TMAO reductase YedYZ molybdopterin-dependent catalytic subunit
MSDENELPAESKLTRTKQRWAREGRFLTGKTFRPAEQRLPPGQHLTRDWPTLDLGVTPNISREHWRLDIYGAVENPIFWNFAQFAGQTQTKFTSDIHCVTTWSRYDNQWEGLATSDLLNACRPREAAGFVVLHCYDGYTTNLALEDFATEDALLAHSWSGAPLEQEHGGRCGWWCRISISGRAPSGSRPSNSWSATRPAIGKSAATITAAIPGPSSATPAIDAATYPNHGD